jgi:hypothetical protein
MKPTDRNKVCPDCGKKFVAHYAAKRCGDCQKKFKLEKARERRDEKRLYDIEYRKKNAQKCKERKKQYYEKNKNRLTEYSREWYSKNRERAGIVRKEYREKNSLKLSLYRKEYCQKNRNKILKAGAVYRENVRQDPKKYKELKAYKAEYQLLNKERLCQIAKEYYEANKEKVKAYKRSWGKKFRENNKEKIKARQKASQPLRNACNAKREAIKKSAILPTTDFEEIKKLYIERAQRTKATGIEHHVDHIIQLSIGGAHHQDNLRVITATENLTRGFDYDPSLGGVWADNDLAKQTKQQLNIA